ncbi:MAG: class II D-tagatose-bisphosphate aldolase, non-catalytic subunit [Desulfobacterales bacterium]
MKALEQFKVGIAQNRAGRGGVAVSVCSAQPDVLRALFRAAKAYRTFALIESTPNQVAPQGGYTGLTPADFAQRVKRIAQDEDFPLANILLGGDHLGTGTWRHLPAAAALNQARQLVAAYTSAGYRKIHLDTGFVCRDDPSPLPEAEVAERCAELVQVAEAHAGDVPLLYVVGSEVPPPGGAQEDARPRITPPERVAATLEVFQGAFQRRNLEAAWERVKGLVVQPGVEFGDREVCDFQGAPELSAAILNHPGMVYEAHSTDFQTAESLRALARDHFYILKVGPWLTYTLREGLYLLELMEKELDPPTPSRFRETLLQTMKADSRHWKTHYRGLAQAIEFKLNFSNLDRARYYLERKEVMAAWQRLMHNLAPAPPEALISQFMPRQYARIRSGQLTADPRELLLDRIVQRLEGYMRAGQFADSPAPAMTVKFG